MKDIDVSDIEQEFYKVFEIQPATVEEYGAYYWHDTIEINGKRYTPIDNEILLNLICVYLKQYELTSEPNNINELKEIVLAGLISYIKVFDDTNIKQQIQALFKDEDTLIFEPTERLPDESDEDLRERIKYKWLRRNDNENN